MPMISQHRHPQRFGSFIRNEERMPQSGCGILFGGSMVNFKGNPFYLDDSQCEWVEQTFSKMTLREKVAQLFFVASAGDSQETLLERYAHIPFGGIMFRGDTAERIRELVECIQHQAKIPMLISGNLENGGNGIVSEGTNFASQLEVAATGEPQYARMLGDVCGAEGAAVGANYTFAPVVDVQFNWRNPIINTRTFGSDPERVLTFAREYMEGIRPHNVAVALKHFPGDGVDERDQHLVSSVNTMSCEEWDATFGKIYHALIQNGAQTVMVGHILLPAYSRRFRPEIKDEEILPASLSPEIVTGLLREKLGFQGLVITDSGTMTGLGCALPRRQIPAAAINAGCDMFLFGRNLEEDFENALEDAKRGKIPLQRLEEAVKRALALKAALRLPGRVEYTAPDYASVIGCTQFREQARQCADKAITLVKDTQKLLPIRPDVHKRILLYILGDNPAFRGGERCKDAVISRLEQEGFVVTCPGEGAQDELFADVPVSELKRRFDLILYVANMVTGGNHCSNRLFYAPRICGESPQHVKDIPTVFVSLGDPFHMVDVPMIPTFINCYNHSEFTLDLLMEKLTGRSPFQGTSPVDPFCGIWGARP